MNENSQGMARRRFSFDTAAIWSLVVTLALAAVVIIPWGAFPFLHTKTFVLAIGVLVTLILFILGRLRQGSMPIPHLPLLGALWIVPLAYLVSMLFSGVRYDEAFFGNGFSPDTVGLMVILALVGTLAAFLLRERVAQRLFLKGLSVTFGLVLVLQVAFYITSKIAPAFISSTFTPVGSFTDLGSFLGLGVALALLAVRFLAVKGIARTLLYVGIALGLIGMALVNSMIAWVLLAVVAFGLFVEAIMYANRHSGGAAEARPLMTPLATLAVSVLFILGGTTIGNALATAAGTGYIDARPSWQSTFSIGAHTYASSPLFGSGPGTFFEKWNLHRDRAINDSIFWSLDFGAGVGHVPTSFVTIGVIGVLAWIGFFGLLLFFGLRMLFTRLPEDPLSRFAMVGSFVGAVYVLALAVLALPGPVTLAIGYALLGLFIASLASSEGRTFVFSQNPRVGFAAVFLLTILLLASIGAGYVVVERYVANIAVTEASTALGSGNVNSAELAVSRALAISPSDTAYRLAALVSLARMNQVINDRTLGESAAREQFQAAVQNAVGAGVAATELGPRNYQNWAVLGNVYGSLVPLSVEGAYENAKASYDRAQALAPTNPTVRLLMGQLEIARRDIPAAEAHLIEAINLKRDYTQAILLFARIEVEAGKAAQALQAAEAAAYFAPNDPGVLLQTGLLRYAAGDSAGAIQALSRAVELNPQFANARFFLGVVYASAGNYAQALAELTTVASFSAENATTLASDIEALREGRNPFPTSRLATLGIPYAPVDEPTPAGVEPATP